MNTSDRIPLIPPTRVKIAVSILSETQDYNHRLMNIPAMWRSTRGAGVKVAILDTGLPKHVDLLPSGGKSFIEGYLLDTNGHSTHCGGIIAATANNNMGVMGIAPDVEDWYGAVLDGDGQGSIDSIINGIRWAVDVVGADIISMSLGIPANARYERALEAVCQYAVNQGVAIFAAAGNEYGAVGQPAQYDCVYAVAAIDKNFTPADFSNRGQSVDFAAGGVDVFSTYLNDTYAKLSGTSMATPALVGVAALILSDARQGAQPRKLTPAELGAKLRKIAFDVGPAGVDDATGIGIPVFQSSGTEPVVPPVVVPGYPTHRPWWQYLWPGYWCL
jgi:minor extracellular protease Epr